ncbi:MAG: hypothetical protein AAFV43_07075 [Planctomycetota bacterium]
MLADPGWDEQLKLLAENRRSRAASQVRWSGVATAELALSARRQVFAKAAAAAGPAGGFDAETPLVVSGHQPELFHPGVLIKNLALDRLAKRAGGVGVHLVIDSDLCRSTSIVAPRGPAERPTHESLVYDTVGVATPYEERRIGDEECLRAFPATVERALAGLIDSPLVTGVWPAVGQAVNGPGHLATVLSAARRALQADWLDRTIELPLSAVCDTDGFRAFAAELLVRCEEVREAYNAALADYRVAHRLRTPAQPLPDLAQDGGGRVETPFWVWSNASVERRPLLAERRHQGVILSDGAGWSADVSANDAIARLGELRHTGVKIRSRALATTLFCRWLLADLFLHGIGGAKYDQVTDAWSQRLLGAAPPPHATLSATLRLPIARPTADVSTPAELRRRLRTLAYHPERFVERDQAGERTLGWLDRKWRAITLAKTPENAAERHREIVAANAALRSAVEPIRAAAEASLSAAGEREHADRMIGSRENSFVLFPRDWLVERLVAMVPIG